MVTRNAKYPMLSTVANALIIIGWILVIAGAIGTLYGLITIGNGWAGITNFLGGLVAVIMGLIGAGAGELVGVAFDIENNTRSMSTSSRMPASS
jgi:hypothetical protein